jgi:hypothetical protein
VDELREEADRIQAELAVAERDWKEWAVARSRVDEVPAPDDETELSTPGGGEAEVQVPVWREGLARSVLPVDCQRILTALAWPPSARTRARRWCAAATCSSST